VDEKEFKEDVTSDKAESKEKPAKEKKKSEKEKLKDDIEQLQTELAALKDQYLRERAELENFKKRTHQERITERKYAAQNVIESLINPIDQLRIVTNMTVDNDVLKNYLIGFKMINDQILGILEQEGLKEIKAMNEMFDPNIHHAIDTVSDKDKPKGMILAVQQTGYMFKERVIRPAMVKVNEWSDENGNNE
jgi:molecular chaperone GrpE